MSNIVFSLIVKMLHHEQTLTKTSGAQYGILRTVGAIFHIVLQG
jgi:hypothetical protein